MAHLLSSVALLAWGTEEKLYKILFGVIFTSNLISKFKGAKNGRIEKVVGKSGE
jgi:hypothetical protein